MQEIVDAILSLNGRDWFDYFSAFVPLILSIVAILIALDTARRQNNIALFEKRYENYKGLLAFTTQWKVSMENYNDLLSEKTDISKIDFQKFVLQISLMNLDEIPIEEISSYFKDRIPDKDKIRNALLKIKDRDSNVLDMTSLLYKSISNDIEKFHRQFCYFFDQFDKVLLGQISHVEFQGDLKNFQIQFANFHKLVHKKITPKIKVRG